MRTRVRVFVGEREFVGLNSALASPDAARRSMKVGGRDWG